MGECLYSVREVYSKEYIQTIAQHMDLGTALLLLKALCNDREGEYSIMLEPDNRCEEVT